jgi:predicted HTH transcriptional regulator
MSDRQNSPKRIAFVVSPITGQELKASQSDAVEVYALLIDRKFGMCDNSSSQLISQCPSRNEFQTKLDVILRNWKTTDQLIFYFSGHGKVERETYCIVMGEDSIPFANIINDIKRAGVNRAILILDACHSGAATGIKNNNFKILESDLIPAGITILASSKESQKSSELKDGSRSVFTHIFCEGIRTGLSGKSTDNDVITVANIVEYIKEILVKNPEYKLYNQHPVYGTDRTESDPWIAKNITKSLEKRSIQNERNSNVSSYDDLKILYERTVHGRYPCISASIDYVNLELVKQYSDRIIPDLFQNENLEEVLERLYLYSHISHNNQKYLHTSAVLCFYQQPHLILEQARSIFLLGNPGDTYFQREDINGALSYQIQQLTERVEKESSAISYIGKGGIREEIPDIDILVARELISNAIVHRNYELNGTVIVKVTKDLLEIKSPGCFPNGISWNKSIDPAYPSGSEPVDPAIALYLSNLLVYEGIGRGFYIFRRYIEENGTDSLTCQETSNQVTIRLLRRGRKEIAHDFPEANIPKLVERDSNFHHFHEQLKPNSDKKKEPCNLPRKSYQDFIGRKEEIAKILKRISPEYRQHITVISGIGGVGKTALAIEVASLCWDAKKNKHNNESIPVFDAIIFTSSKATDFVNTQILERPEKESQLTDIFRVIADVLNEPTITQVLATEQHQKVREVLLKQSTLLVVDNMETLSDNEQNKILSFLNNVPYTTQVLITTRESQFSSFENILIKSLTRKESYDLLRTQIKNKGINPKLVDYRKWRQQVYDRFRGIPIALIYVVGQLAAGYQPDDIVNSKITITTEKLGKFCFKSSIDGIKSTPAYQLLLAMAFFNKSPCREALTKVSGLTDDNTSTAKAIVKLKQLSLITEDKGRYDILPITLEYVIQELEAPGNAQFKLSAREYWYKWYLEFVQQYAGLDWEGWRAKYDRLDVEWENIQSVLNWCAEKAEWRKLLDIWQNVDNYADLSGYWQDRRYWWALLGNNYGSAEVKVKALSEQGFTLTLMGTQHYEDAEDYLKRAWDLCSYEIDKFVSAGVANHRAVLDKVRQDYEGAHFWIDTERDLLKDCPSDKKREQKRYQVRNHYYRGEVLYLEHKLDLAKDEFNRAIEFSREIGWQRFRNYAKNMLADIYIKEGNLEAAEILLKTGFSSATQARESRRIALYQASYGQFYYQKCQQEKEKSLSDDLFGNIVEAQNYASKALEVFSKEFMVVETEEIQELMRNLEIERKELNLTIEQEQNMSIDN